MQVITIGLDIAKSVFQVHGEDACGKIVIQKRLRRSRATGFFAKLAPARVGIVAAADATIPARLQPALHALLGQIEGLQGAIVALEAQIMATAKTDPVMRRLAAIPGIGGLAAHAIVTAIGDGRRFRTARDFAAWCGLTPRDACQRRQAARDGYQPRRRHPLAQAVGARRQHHHALRPRPHRPRHCLAARHPRPPPGQQPAPAKAGVAGLAQAAKTARIAWAMLVSGAIYRQPSRAAGRAA
jgi:transposase